MKVWSLTTLRRWAASPNSFTLDFGDYSDSYYSVQTSEGDQISQLIAGYIDIILKKKKDAERILNDEDTELAITEENIGTGQGSISTLIFFNIFFVFLAHYFSFQIISYCYYSYPRKIWTSS